MARARQESPAPRIAGAVRGGALLMAAAVALVLAGCTGPSPEAPRDDPDSVALRITTATGGGRLDADDRADVESAIGAVLSQYVGAAYLGDHPRSGYLQALARFTDGAAELAARDLDVLTAAGDVEFSSVLATRLDTDLSLYVVDGDALGATARVHFAFDATTAEDTPQELRLDGRLMLTPTRDGWAVFGYDVTSDDGAALGEDGS
ncbi:MAG TPA: hypothetical protein VFH10_15695 [Nocardioides sp.]|uniref:hypothetical protein n=1 Tax=Nocardioides sp. TaxID=35761 RepID=UPI002D800BE0|nr:hypothetical protein [Nocardioides sp.]HET6654081.1 hypothetical protein [Nocardioides sp.]